MKRRDFIAITGTGAAAAVAPEVFYKSLWWLWGSEGFAHDWQEIPKGVESFIKTVCQQCPGGCGAVVRMVGGRPVKIDGNPSHPVSKGGFCPKGQATLQSLYHPARVQTPLRRVGDRGSGEWESISWDEALDEVVSKLKDIRGEGPQTVAFVDGEESDGLMRKLIKRFMDVYGSPNSIIKTSSQADEHLMKSSELDGGQGYYDLSKAEYVLNFGLNFIETSYSPLQTVKAYSQLRENEAKLVYVGSRLSVTGIKSNDWVKVNPGTEGLLAIGIAKVIIEEGLFNKNFVNSRTSHFEEFEGAVSRFSFEQIEHETGVSLETIEDIAGKFAARKEGAVAIGNSGSVADQTAINSLNLLTGSIARMWLDHDEGAIPFSELPESKLDRIAEGGVSQSRVTGDFQLSKSVFATLPDNILSRRPYELNALFVYYSNPLLSVPDTEKMRKALERVPFIVNFSPFMDETAQVSDLILPDHTPLERWQDAPQVLIDGTPVLGCRQPIVEPLHDTMQTGDVLINIARRYGAPLQDAFPWENFKDFLMESLEGVFNSGQGSIADGGSYSSFEDWTQGVLESGWSNPDGRKPFEGVAKFQPEYVSKVSRGTSHSDEYPFHLNVYKLMSMTRPRNTAQPTLFDIAAPHIFRKWVAWVEINTETAHELGIEDEDWVWVESKLGREKFKAKLYEGTMSDVVNTPLIIGSKGYEPWIKDTEQNAFKIVEGNLDPWDGNYSYDTKVKIYKV